jgi:hypothetical protein
MSFPLTDLPLEVIETLEAFLRLHHVARLVLTGDPKLVTLIKSCRRRKSTFLDIVRPSDLLIQVLLGGAHTVNTSLKYFDVGHFSNVRNLTLSSISTGNLRPDMLDFSRLHSLERLSLGKWIKVNNPITLPTSITSLELYSVDDGTPIANLASLASLGQLCISSFTEQEHADAFVTTSIWPASLRSLRISVHDGMSSVKLRMLPSSITNLYIVANSYNYVLDVSDLVCDRPALRSLITGVTTSVINSRLPLTLTALLLTRIRIQTADAVLAMFLNLPSSLTSFSFSTIRRVDGTRMRACDIQAGFEVVLPRVPLGHVLSAMRFPVITRPFVDGEWKQAEFFTPLLRKFGLADKFEALQKAACVSRNFHLLTDDEIHNILLGGPVKPSSIVRAIDLVKDKSLLCMNNQEWSDNRRANIWRASLHLLETGFTSELRLPDCDALLPSLAISEAALHNLVTIVATTWRSSNLLSVLMSNVFSCLESIRILHSEVGEMTPDTVVGAICGAHANFPRLERLDCSGFQDALSAPLVAKLRQLFKLIPCPSTSYNTYVYSVSSGT